MNLASLSWKNEALLLFLWPQDNPLEFLPQSSLCVHISALSSYSPPAAPAWLHPPPLPPPASGIPRSGRWSSWSPAADAVSCWHCCCCCCICLWEDRNSQSTSAGQLRSSGPLACFTWIMQTSDTCLHLTQIQAKTPFKSAIELKYTLLEWQKNYHNNRETYGMRFNLLKTLKSMDLNDLLSILGKCSLREFEMV